MNSNPYLYEKFVQAHQQELLREAEQHHLARLSLRSPSIIDTVVSRLRAFFVRPVSAKPAEVHVRTHEMRNEVADNPPINLPAKQSKDSMLRTSHQPLTFQ